MRGTALHRLAGAARMACALLSALAAVPCPAAGGQAAAREPVRVSISVPAPILPAGSVQSVTVEVESDGGGPAPTGTVSLRIRTAGRTASEQTLELSPSTATGSTATARIGLPPVAGSASADAAYAGDATHATGVGRETIALLHASSVSVASSRNPSPSGEDVELTFTVASQDPSAIPTGHVRVRSTTVDRLLPLVEGSARLTLKDPAAGRHDFSAQYWPDTAHLQSSASFRQDVVDAAPSVARGASGAGVAADGTGPRRDGRLFLAGLIAAIRSGGEAGPFGARADGLTVVRLLGGTSMVGSWPLAATGFAPRHAGVTVRGWSGAFVHGAGTGIGP